MRRFRPLLIDVGMAICLTTAFRVDHNIFVNEREIGRGWLAGGKGVIAVRVGIVGKFDSVGDRGGIGKA